MLPNLLIIGAMKCGTTSLHNYLSVHPEIYMNEEKELNYFIDTLNYKKGLDWYKSKFINKNSKILGESSPNYSKYPLFKNVPENIFNTIPNVKIIYIVRDPIKRLISHYQHNYILGRERRSLKESLDRIDNNKYLTCSMYYLQISRYLKYFNEADIFIIDSENLLNDCLSTLQSIFGFLGVEKNFISEEFNIKFHITNDNRIHNNLGVLIYKKGLHIRIKQIIPGFIYNFIFKKKAEIPNIDDSVIQSINNYLLEDRNNFIKLTGQQFPSWYI